MITVELPDPNTDLDGYTAACKYILHGPYGTANIRALCMLNGKCSKFFPKNFCAQTTIDANGFVIYRRRNNGIMCKNNLLDNRFVATFNRNLIVKYQAHLNVQICTHGTLMNYLLEYFHKGPDRAKAVIENIHSHAVNTTDRCSTLKQVASYIQSKSDNQNSPISHLYVAPQPINEVKTYLDCHYLSVYESTWRIFYFPIHEQNPTIHRLPVHLPNMNHFVFLMIITTLRV